MTTPHVSPSSAEWSMLSLADKDPFPSYDLLRRSSPVIWDPGMKCWLVLSYDLCKVIESDESSYRNPNFDAPPLFYEIKGDNNKMAVSSLVGEKHARMRRLLLKLLSPAAVARYREAHVLPVINDAVDRFCEKGSAELVSQLSDPVPPRVMASLFGLPWRDDALIADLSRWHGDVVAWLYGRSSEELAQKAKRASDELNDLFRPLVLERRRKRGADFISQIWSRSPEDLGEIGVDDVMAIVRDVELGAGETTTNAIANAIYLFLSDPAVREAVTKDPDGALNAFVEETLRLLGSIQFRFRIANRDVPLAGAMVKKDDALCLVHAAANRDPEHYACPHMIDLNRRPPTDHMAFNVGPRICVGMHLARLKIRECLKALIARFPDLRLDPTKEAPRFRAFSHRCFAPLYVVF
ncbi:cytochrome P450 [Bradyrhizobium brasilense]|uniref:cytochrome P450 n=1 Tax=Bradyrhizobium brasilense TaxID=1419277 RepID=UPI001E51AC22|nr:cytochrome P450 [Bradyrhizobium brasilense]MCC8969159.1 cytochrome P450 [Bradyrhizobium brasilense]